MDPVVTIYSLFGPFLVWPVEYFLPYPHIVEEIFKVFVVLSGPLKLRVYLIAGVLFAFTETVLYIINVNTTGSISYMATRFVLTSILHSSTFVVIYLSRKQSKKLIVLGFLAAVLIHYLYNSLISTP